jgi:hypothetical protein
VLSDTQNACRLTGDVIVTPWQAWVKSLNSWTVAIRDRRAAARSHRFIKLFAGAG